MKTSIKIELYDCIIEMHVVDYIKDVEELTKKIFKKHKIKEEVETAYGRSITTFKKYYLLVSKEENYINTFFHELYHIIDMISEDRYIKDSESKACLQGLIGDKLLKKLLNVNTSTSNITSI
jgi:2-polyprenyl-3-methyl-5-hydroxy-6-metoxy-1,4-benzoquinol methylase